MRMNFVGFVGKVVELPELKESAMGNKFATLLVRIMRPYANSEGVYEHDEIVLTLWKGIAETTTKVCRVGDTIAVKGRLQSHTYEGRDGLMHRNYDIIAEHVSFITKEPV